MSTRPKTTTTAAAGLLAGVLAALTLGSVDALYALSQASDLASGGADYALACFFSAGLYAPLTLALGAGVGLALGQAPVDLGPRGAWRGLLKLVAARGDEASRLAGALWGGGLGLLVTYGAMFWLNRTFMTTFHNETLSALLLAMVTLALLALFGAATVWACRRLTSALSWLSDKAGVGMIRAPLVPVVLALAAVVGLVAWIPIRFEETWDAIDLSLPAMALALPTTVWLATGLLSRLGALRGGVRKRLAAAAVALVVGLGGLFVPTVAGMGPAHASLGFALGEKSMLTRFILKTVQSRYDEDGDGYSAVLAGGDCDDANPDVNPAAEDTPDNGVDEDCDGSDFHLPPEPVADDGAVDPAADGAGGGEEAPAEQGDPLDPHRKKWNIVWIMVDTLRWDRLGYAGYERPTSPNVDKVAEEATIFENGYSVSAKTPTAIAPIMASRYPSEMPRSFNHFVRYDDDNVLLAEYLADAGYLTAASSAHWYFKRKYGMAQGMHRWTTYEVDSDKMEKIPTSKEVTDTAITMLDHLSKGELPPKGEEDADAPEPKAWTGEGERPFFLYVHYLDPHKHYIDHEGFEPFGHGGENRYDGEIRFTDHHIGRLIEALKEKDPGLQNTIIAFTSDHGEAFGEHEMRFHGWDLYEHQIRAAFFIYLPGGEAQRVKKRATLMDLTPTLLDAVGIERPDKMRGETMLPTLALGKDLGTRPIFTEMPPGPYNVHFRSLTIGDLKLIHRLHGNVYRLFDLEADPDEAKNILKSDEARAKKMREAFQIFKARNIEQVEAKK